MLQPAARRTAAQGSAARPDDQIGRHLAIIQQPSSAAYAAGSVCADAVCVEVYITVRSAET